MKIPAKSIIIKSTNWIGDVVISIPSIKALRQIYKDAGITVLCKPYMAEIYENLGIIDKTVCMENNLPGTFYKIIKELRLDNYDLGILLQNAINGAILFYLSGIKHRLGYPTDARGIFLTDKPRDNYKNSHQMERYLGLIRYLGFEGKVPSPFIPTPFDDNTGDRGFLFEMISKKLDKPVYVSKHIIGIAPGAKYGPAKMWGESNFRELIRLLLDKKDLIVLLIGSKEDHDLSEKLASKFASEGRVYNACGYFSIMESLFLIGELDILVSNDSGAMHMGAARNVNITAIFGPTIFGYTSPISDKTSILFKKVDCWPCRHRICPKNTHKCMDQIKPAEVFENIVQRIIR